MVRVMRCSRVDGPAMVIESWEMRKMRVMRGELRRGGRPGQQKRKGKKRKGTH